MFRQFLIAPADLKYLRILWRFPSSEPIKIYELLTVTYGTTSAPYQAIQALLQLATDEEYRLPAVARLIRKNTYADDTLAGHDTLEGAKQLQSELIQLLKAGGLRLSKWTANHASLLKSTDLDDQASTSKQIGHQDEHQILGVSWQPDEDNFRFHAKFQPSKGPITKRNALSLIAQLFKPLGWISPVVIQFKIFMQSLWHAGLQWDDALPKHHLDQWINRTHELDDLADLTIPRWSGFTSNLKLAEVHGFADASERAYAAVV